MNEEEQIVFNIFKEITDIFKEKFNYKINYLEYLSALLYLKYSNYEYFVKVYQEIHKNDILKIFDYWLEEEIKKNNNKYLFSNISFLAIQNDNIDQFKNIILLLYKIETLIGLNIVENKKIVAVAYANLLEFSIKNSNLVFENEGFYTPLSITNLVMQTLNVQNKKVLDPYCGSGNFLISAAQNGTMKIYGKENNLSNYNICMTNLFLNNINNQNVIYDKANNYNFNDHAFDKFDFIVSNPSFSTKTLKENKVINNGHFLGGYNFTYVLDMLNNLNVNGTMAIIIPHGFLFRKSDILVREKLIENNLIKAIIGLPDKLFFNNRISVAILILSKEKKDNNILFIDASNKFTTVKSNKYLSSDIQNEIATIYKENKEIKEISRLVPYPDIINNNFDLTIKLYVKKEITKETINKKEMIEEIEDIKKEIKSTEKIINALIDNF